MLHGDYKVLNFNYTEFVETLYGAKRENICYIHGCRRNDKGKKPDEIILGHKPGMEEEQWDKVELKPFKFKNPYKRYIMEAAMETAVREAAWYDESTTKKCGDIIKNHKDFFDGLSSIEEVFVIGHSLSEVDYPYFEEVRSRCDAKWHIGYHSLDDMKRLIATYALLMVLSMIVVSCEHKELCYSHPHSAKVSVEFEWSQMPAAYSPGGMRVIFYPRNGGEEIVRDFVGKKGGCVEIPSGVYDVVCFNNDTQRVKYNGADGFSSIAATTGVAQVGDVKAFRTPDYLCGGRMVAVKVEVKIGCEQIIVLPVAPMVCYYTYTVRGVKNLQSFSECVAIQRAMCSEYSVGGDNEIQESKADICFAMERNDDVITGWCYTFGAADCDVYKTILYIRTASGKMVKGEYDVTQQINSQKGHLKNVDIVIDTDLDLDKHGGSSPGFDPSVDEWEDIESDIIL